jgi:hypothetical protein
MDITQQAEAGTADLTLAQREEVRARFCIVTGDHDWLLIGEIMYPRTAAVCTACGAVGMADVREYVLREYVLRADLCELARVPS